MDNDLETEKLCVRRGDEDEVNESPLADKTINVYQTSSKRKSGRYSEVTQDQSVGNFQAIVLD